MTIPFVDGMYDTTLTSGTRSSVQIDRMLEHQHLIQSFGGVTISQIIDWALPEDEEWKPTNIVRDSNGAVVSADITWPNGATGKLITDVFSTAFPGAIDAFHITYKLPGLDERTLTQPTVTRDINGVVTYQPEIVIS